MSDGTPALAIRSGLQTGQIIVSGHNAEHFRKTGVSKKNNFNDDDAVFIARVVISGPS